MLKRSPCFESQPRASQNLIPFVRQGRDFGRSVRSKIYSILSKISMSLAFDESDQIMKSSFDIYLRYVWNNSKTSVDQKPRQILSISS